MCHAGDDKVVSLFDYYPSFDDFDTKIEKELTTYHINKVEPFELLKVGSTSCKIFSSA
jgi:hypothetical protein